jgi:hypothetical protein
MSVRRRVVAPLGALAILAIGLSACGEDDFENESRPAATIETTVKIDDREVDVSPGEFGAGIVNFTISNQSRDPAVFTLSGPTDESTSEIAPGGVEYLKTALEQGRYAASAGEASSAREDRVVVGPPRETSQNQLLLP